MKMVEQRYLVFAALLCIALFSTSACREGGKISADIKSQKQVQDTVVSLYQRTLDAFPPGYKFDAARFGGTGSIVDCNDNAMGDEVSPINYLSYRDMIVPHGAPLTGIVEKLGDIWKRFGWDVVECDGIAKPNRYATTKDGFFIRAVARDAPGDPPGIVAGSPCYDGHLRRYGIPIPVVLQSPGT